MREVLRGLVADGRVVRLPRSRYALAGAGRQRVQGTITFTRSGLAFVVLPQGERDVLIEKGEIHGALAGDTVLVDVHLDVRDARPVGRVVEILERAHKPLVGVLRRDARGGHVEVMGSTGAAEVLLPTEAALGEARDGDVVSVELTAYGSRRYGPVGAVLDILGRADDARTDTLAVLHRFGLDASFPAAVEEEARQAAGAQHEDTNREDHSQVLVLVIDPEDARDHDDALSVEPYEKDGFEVGIHIADVSWYVRPGSALDAEAYQRGTSVYLVDRAIPMLPEALSADACSLKGDELRRALSLFVRLDSAGEVLGHRLARTWIRPQPVLTYERAHRVLEGTETEGPPVVERLHTLSRLAEILRGTRQARGSLDFDLPEPKVVIGDDGQPVAIRTRERLDTHRIIEEWMLLANQLVAKDCVRRKIPVLFRTHEAPDPQRMEEVGELLQVFGHSVPHSWSPKSVQAVLEVTRDRPEEALVHQAVLRAMMRARYDSEPSRHFGLAFAQYLHFTSPIRRYPDLLVHRALTATLLDSSEASSARGLPQEADSLAEAAQHTSARERLADDAGRESVELAQFRFMQQRVGDTFSGRIERVAPFGFFVRPDDVFATGLVHVRTLDDYFELDPAVGGLIGARSGRIFKVGDDVRVQLSRVDRSERQIDFLLLEAPRSHEHGSAMGHPGASTSRRRGDRKTRQSDR